MEKRVCIVHFNTPELIRATILSLWKNTPDCKVTVFDNSTDKPFIPMPEVEVLDNTKGQIIDFKKFLDQYPDKQPTTNDWGSAKHCYTIDKLWEYYPDGFVLMDSDVLVQKDISIFWDERFAFVGTVYRRGTKPAWRTPRVLPYICWINVPMCTANGMRYYDGTRNWQIYKKGNPWYDTGASFYEDCVRNRLPGKCVDIYEYVLHFQGGSYRYNKDWVRWLEDHKDLYE